MNVKEMMMRMIRPRNWNGWRGRWSRQERAEGGCRLGETDRSEGRELDEVAGEKGEGMSMAERAGE
jgi:hypothetical protein